MTEQDRLAELKRWLAVERQPKPYPATRTGTTILPDEWIDWLVGEVERLRAEVNHLDHRLWSEYGGELGDSPWTPPYPAPGTTNDPPPD